MDESDYVGKIIHLSLLLLAILYEMFSFMINYYKFSMKHFATQPYADPPIQKRIKQSTTR